ncbi:MAG: beta-propeller fold lactonase family protein [Acidobacteria bacterium]|nr:beta-propeller fold lactonase family protein [Acidobacteriota bacterium]
MFRQLLPSFALDPGLTSRTLILLALAVPVVAQEPALVVVEKKASQVGFYTSAGERVAGVAVGETPHEMLLDPDGRRLYVTDNGVLWMDYQGPGGATISIVDIQARKKAGVIPTSPYRRPHGLSFDPKARRLIVTSENPDSIFLVDPDTRAVIQAFDNGGKAPHIVTFGPDAKWAFASNSNSDTVGAVEIATGEVTLIDGCGRPQGGALNADGSRYYVTCSNSATIQVIDTAARTAVGEIRTGKGVNRIAVTPDQKTLVYSIGGEGTQLGFADVATLKETGRVDLGGSPLSCSLSKNGKYAFAGVQDNDEIYVVSVADRKVIHVIKTPEGHGPDPVMEIGEYKPPR